MNKCTYKLDEFDRIVSVGDNWLLFAQENQAGESCDPEKIINKSIWNFITGFETRHFYKIILKTVRTRKKAVKLPFRCDAPGKRRFLELTIIPAEQESVEFSSDIISEELRDTVVVLQAGIPRSHESITMCSVCKRVALSDNTWVEVEDAVLSLKLFEKKRLPQISHGLCTECLELRISEIDKSCT